MSRLLERMGVELPIVQAGMGGGIARHELAAAVSEAGGLGTLGLLPRPGDLASELAALRGATGSPAAVNVLLPFTRDRHWRELSNADAVVTFWGRPRRRVPGVWLHQCGSVEEALAAREAGADGVIAQGVEAGGHVRGTTPALELLARVRRAVGPGYTVWVAGGLATPEDVAEALGAGADAAVLGTRFLMSPESHAHPGYRVRVAEARQTVLTELFGLGWAAAHRVVPNRATARWLARGDRGPVAIRLLNRASGVLRRLPPLDLSARQRPGLPLLSAQMPTDRHPDSLLEAGPLYAGTSALRIDDVRPAAELTRELASRAP